MEGLSILRSRRDDVFSQAVSHTFCQYVDTDDFPPSILDADDFPPSILDTDDFPPSILDTDDFPPSILDTDDFPPSILRPANCAGDLVLLETE